MSSPQRYRGFPEKSHREEPWGAYVAPINPSDNRSFGSCLRYKLSGVPNGGNMGIRRKAFSKTYIGIARCPEKCARMGKAQKRPAIAAVMMLACASGMPAAARFFIAFTDRAKYSKLLQFVALWALSICPADGSLHLLLRFSD
jgi:hypothetical protein